MRNRTHELRLIPECTYLPWMQAVCSKMIEARLRAVEAVLPGFCGSLLPIVTEELRLARAHHSGSQRDDLLPIESHAQLHPQ